MFSDFNEERILTNIKCADDNNIAEYRTDLKEKLLKKVCQPRKRMMANELTDIKN